MAVEAGFRVESFSPDGTRLGKIVSRLPLLRNSIMTDILSLGASAYLKKTISSAGPSPARQANSES